MPILNRPVTWASEHGDIPCVSDPRYRVSNVNHGSPANLALYRRTKEVAFEIFDKLDNPGNYDYYQSSEEKSAAYFESNENAYGKYADIVYLGNMWVIYHEPNAGLAAGWHITPGLSSDGPDFSPGYSTNPVTFSNMTEINYDTKTFAWTSRLATSGYWIYFPYGAVRADLAALGSPNIGVTTETAPPGKVGRLTFDVTVFDPGCNAAILAASAYCGVEMAYGTGIGVTATGSYSFLLDLHQTKLINFWFSGSGTSTHDRITIANVRLLDVTDEFTEVPKAKKHTTNVMFNINPFNVHPKLSVVDLEEGTVPVRADYLDDHPYFKYYNAIHNGDITDLRNKYEHTMHRWSEVWLIYDLFIALLEGVQEFSDDLFLNRAKKLVEKYHIGITDEVLIAVFENGLKSICHLHSADPAIYSKLYTLVEALRREFYVKRFGSTMQHT